MAKMQLRPPSDGPRRELTRAAIADDENFVQQLAESLQRIEGGLQDILEAVEALTDHAVSRAVVVPPPPPADVIRQLRERYVFAQNAGMEVLTMPRGLLCATLRALDPTSTEPS